MITCVARTRGRRPGITPFTGAVASLYLARVVAVEIQPNFCAYDVFPVELTHHT
jgi:hypothetical protein